MTSNSASHMASEILKAYLGGQTLPIWGSASPEESGEQIGNMLTAIHAKLAKHLQSADAD